MSAPRPTNERVVELLEQIIRELMDAKKRQERLAVDLARVAKRLAA